MYSSTKATSKTALSTPNKVFPKTASAVNRQLYLRHALSALNAETPTQKNGKTYSVRQNVETIPKSQHRRSHKQPIPLHERLILLHVQPQRLELFAQHGRRVIEYVQHRLPGAHRLLQSFPGHLDNELVSACSPRGGQDAPNVVVALVLIPLQNLEELPGYLELTIGVKPHPRHADLAQFAFDVRRTRALFRRWQHATVRSKCI